MSKIESIEVKSIKAISHLQVNFKGQTAIITGANNSGKSTLLNALRQRMQSVKVDFTVKENEEDGSYEMRLTTGEQFIWKVKANGNDSMTFISKDGIKGSLTQEIIQKYFAPMFDIDKFLNASPKDRSLMLQKMVGLDFSKIDAEYNGAYQERALAKRMLDSLPAVEVCDPLLPEQAIDLSKLQNEIMEAEKNNRTKEEAIEKSRSAFEKHANILKEIVKLQEQAKILDEEGKKYYDLYDSLIMIDIMEKQTQFNEAIELNKKIEQANQNKELIGRRNVAYQAVVDSEEKVKVIEEQKKKMIAKSNLPKGFTIKNDAIYVDFLPLSKENLSTSQVYIAALKIASLNMKEVKFLTFDASPLDRKNLDEIQAWANEHGFQLLIEKPDFEGGDIRVELVEVKA
jgi:energy-coupling factor transporter ATP-binding protein EcfA2